MKNDEREEREQRPMLEGDVLPRRRVAVTLTCVAVLTVILTWVGGLLMHARWADLRPSGKFPEAEPRAEGNAPYIEQEVFRRESAGLALVYQQREELTRWGWADAEHRRVRIPIDRAIDVVVEGEKR